MEKNSSKGNSLSENKELTTFLDSAMKAVNESVLAARQVLLKYLGHLSLIGTKKKSELVTEADKESENIIRKILKKNFPSFSLLGEEEGLEEPKSKQPGLWIIDPLDGTTNYIHQFPIFCISIALEWKKEIVLGVVDVPFINRTYSAKKNQGAWMNNTPLQVSQTKDLEKALVATGLYPYDSPKDLEWQLSLFERMVKKTRGVRRTGAASFDLCMVAEGVFDAFWEKHLKPWDTAAGFLMIKEAGGIILNYEGKDFHPTSPTILTANPYLIKKMILEIQNMNLKV